MEQFQIETRLGVPVYWESGANPPTDLENWFGTLKEVITARDNLEIDKFLKLKLSRSILFYPTLSTYEDLFERQTDDEES